MQKLTKIILIIHMLLVGEVCAQYTKSECQQKINNLREIYMVILGKIPLLPPLAQLSSGIQRAINDGEKNKELGSYEACVQETESSIQIVQGYAK